MHDSLDKRLCRKCNCHNSSLGLIFPSHFRDHNTNILKVYVYFYASKLKAGRSIFNETSLRYRGPSIKSNLACISSIN